MREEVGKIIDRFAEIYEWDVESEAENNQKIDLLARVTGLKNLSDYIYWPDTVGLDLHASKEEIVTKVLEDMKRL